MENLASIFIEKAVIGNNIHIFQIGAVFLKDSKFKYFCKFIKNEIKNSYNSIDLSEAVQMLDKLIQNKKLILKNDDNNDFLILNRCYQNYLNKPFNNEIYDIAKNSKFIGLTKTNLEFLSEYYDTNFKNIKELPVSVFKAQKIFIIGTKMFNLN